LGEVANPLLYKGLAKSPFLPFFKIRSIGTLSVLYSFGKKRMLWLNPPNRLPLFAEKIPKLSGSPLTLPLGFRTVCANTGIAGAYSTSLKNSLLTVTQAKDQYG
jgi:hypothetical protein